MWPKLEYYFNFYSQLIDRKSFPFYVSALNWLGLLTVPIFVPIRTRPERYRDITKQWLDSNPFRYSNAAGRREEPWIRSVLAIEQRMRMRRRNRNP
jgi:hypothetical protein